MALRPKSVDDWCQLMPNLLEKKGWNHAKVTPGAALMHTSCPWGGQLIKFELLDILIHDAPSDPANVMVRPEVRTLHDALATSGWRTESLEVLAPGEALVEFTSPWRIVKLCRVLFGDMAGRVMNYFFDTESTTSASARGVAWHQEVRRNSPKAGDSGCACWREEEDDGRQSQEFMVLMRPATRKDSRTVSFTVFVVARTGDRFAHWATPLFGPVLALARSTALSFVNRQGIAELREQDARFYLTLSMQSFKRGFPLLPASEDESSLTEIDAGEPYGLRRWVRYEPQDPNSQKFQLSSYLQVFLGRLGYHINAYQTLDGESLVSYQCVVRRDEWELIREPILQAYALQRTAYRHANGGSGAPALHEDSTWRSLPHRNREDLQERLFCAKEPRLVVRKTFFDVEEPSEDEEDQHVVGARAMQRPKTMVLERVPVLVA
ncbi:unnamed protein product [Durusdinium trenchii]|uniref:Uncharacterized protein n=1 Tax=Durusdinium trenchii TaxID=1381693 RepID=A0ABP0IMZ9_9DINO